jgi:tetratricopeptide (TPR) repeat protein
VIFSIFDLFSLFYLFRGAMVVVQLARNWQAFWDAEITRTDRQLANNLAFFILIPLGVFLHEAGHAVATWQVGGEVVEFQWRVFWGYIIPAGNFTPLQDWWIALSGNLVSIALGLAAVPLLWVVRRGIWAEIIESFARQQSFYALVWYPLFSSFTGFGDWVTIYNFSLAPWAHLMAVAHAGTLLGLLWLDRSPALARLRLGRNPAEAEAVRELEAAAEAQGAAAPLARVALYHLGHGDKALAERHMRRAAQIDPNDPTLNAARAHLAFLRRRPRQAEKAARAALEGGLPAELRGDLHRLLAFSLMEGGQREEAVAEYTRALGYVPNDHDLYYWRAIVQRSLGRREAARADFEQSERLAPNEAGKHRARLELDSTPTAL